VATTLYSMTIKLVAVALLAVITIEVMAQRQVQCRKNRRQGPPYAIRDYKAGSEILCECRNPWQGNLGLHERGEPENTCCTGRQRFCYVDCRSSCRDKKTLTNGLCWSKGACDPDYQKTYGPKRTIKKRG